MKRAPDGCSRPSRICGGPTIWQNAAGYHIACFLAQQIGGKALKAFLYAQGEEIVIGHSVERLCRAATRFDPAFDQLVARWSILDGYYIPTRYPNSVPDSIPAHVFTRDAAKEAWTAMRRWGKVPTSSMDATTPSRRVVGPRTCSRSAMGHLLQMIILIDRSEHLRRRFFF